MLHRPQQENGVTMWWGGWRVPEMGASNLEVVTELMEVTHITLVDHQGFWCPRMGRVYHSHPLHHHERVHGPTGWSGGTNIGTDGAQFTDKRVSHHGLWEEQTAGQVPVSRLKGGANTNAVLVVLDVTRGVADCLK
jgi:hypothetical protein